MNGKKISAKFENYLLRDERIFSLYWKNLHSHPNEMSTNDIQMELQIKYPDAFSKYLQSWAFFIGFCSPERKKSGRTLMKEQLLDFFNLGERLGKNGTYWRLMLASVDKIGEDYNSFSNVPEIDHFDQHEKDAFYDGLKGHGNSWSKDENRLAYFWGRQVRENRGEFARMKEIWNRK